MTQNVFPVLNDAGEPMSSDEIMEYLDAQLRASESLAEDFRKFMSGSLADLAAKHRSDWPCGFRLFYVKGMELLDGRECDALRVDFVAMPPISHEGKPTEAEIDYAAEYMMIYQCGLQLSEGEDQEVIGFISVLKNSEIEKNAALAREWIDRIRKK